MPPFAVSVALSPIQIELSLAETVMLGTLSMVTVVDAEPAQPLTVDVAV